MTISSLTPVVYHCEPAEGGRGNLVFKEDKKGN